jgi:hypothetical protein
MQRLVAFFVFLVVAGLTIDARQQQLRGQIVNRDGAAQQCQVNFFAGTSAEPLYRLASDAKGYFYLNYPKPGAYRVEVAQGSRRDEFKRVTIDDYGLHPSTLVVRW